MDDRPAPRRPEWRSRPFLAPLLWLICVTILSVMPNVRLPQFNLFSADKLAHAFVYGYLVWLLYWAFCYNPHPAVPTRRQGFYFFMFASVWGMAMEFVQGSFYVNRMFEVDDMVANCFGAAVGWGLAAWWFGRQRSTALPL